MTVEGPRMRDPVDVERLGGRLRRARKERDATLEEVYKATGVSIATLSRIERGGSKDIDAGTLVSLCKWMGVGSVEFRAIPQPPRPSSRHTPANTPEAVE